MTGICQGRKNKIKTKKALPHLKRALLTLHPRAEQSESGLYTKVLELWQGGGEEEKEEKEEEEEKDDDEVVAVAVVIVKRVGRDREMGTRI